jgi:hypothetical protein
VKGFGKEEEIRDFMHIESYRTKIMVEKQAEEDHV